MSPAASKIMLGSINFREFLDEFLRVCLVCLSFKSQLDNFRKSCVGGKFSRFDFNVPAFVQGSGKNLVPRMLVFGNRLTGNRCFVDGSFTANDFSVEWDQIARFNLR
jgi:hypothetical protein